MAKFFCKKKKTQSINDQKNFDLLTFMNALDMKNATSALHKASNCCKKYKKIGEKQNKIVRYIYYRLCEK